MWQIAQMHEQGVFGEINLPKAIEIYTEAARLGSPSSMFSLQTIVEHEELKAEILEEILDEASIHIAQTSSQLAAELGLAQVKGKLGKNPQRGFYLLEKSAEKRNELALEALGKLHQQGKYCAQDLDKSQYWFKRLELFYQQTAKEGNTSDAMIGLGNLYLYGHCGEVDLIKAKENFIKAAEKEDCDAMIYLGWCCLSGETELQDTELGNYWINKAIKILTERALSGTIQAAMSLVEEIYLDEDIGYQDYQKASEWLHFAAEKGSIEAKLKLVILCFEEKIFQENCPKFIKYLEKVIIKISPEWTKKALRVLGDFYEAEQHYPKAVFWYKKAVNLGNSIAMYKMGTLYEKGALGEVDVKKAIEYYRLSADRKNQEGIAALSRLQNCLDELKEESSISMGATS